MSSKERVLQAREARLRESEGTYLLKLASARRELLTALACVARHDEPQPGWLLVSLDVARELEHVPSTPSSVAAPFSASAKIRILNLRETLAEMSETELGAETERLSCRAMEVESVLRTPLDAAAAVEGAHATMRAHALFLERLAELARCLDANVGLVFQELLGRSSSAVAGHLDRDRIRDVLALEQHLDATELPLMVEQARALCSLVRVKIEDANDLSLAGTVLEDTRNFFEQLQALAELRATSQWALWTQVRL